MEDFYINRFGKKLYSLFFENYTKTVWGRHPSALSADWGAQRIKGVSVSKIIKDAILKPFSKKSVEKQETSLIEEFLYPDLGPGEMWDALAEKIKELGGEIIFNADVIKIHKTNDQIIDFLIYRRSGKELKIKPDFVVSSLPLKSLINFTNSVPEKIKKIAGGLKYRDYITVGLLIKNSNTRPPKIATLKDTWLYIHDKNVKLGRIQIYNNWSKLLVKNPKKYTWVGLEYFTNTNKKFWKKTDKEIISQGIKELKKLGLINRNSDVVDAHVERVEKAYPAYFGTYKKIDRLQTYLNKIQNLYCVGRNGQHRYNNMDHSMMTALEAVKNIRYDINSEKPTDKSNIWAVNTEEVYHETNNLKVATKNSEEGKKATILGLARPLFFAFLIWAIITLVTALVFHENWEDEAQAWLTARDCNLPELISRMKIEGHFLPWYLLMMPFAKLGLPYKTVSFLNWAIFAWGIYLFLKHYPGKTWKKALLIFSSAFLFWYPVVARCYCFLLPGTMLMIKNYNERYKKPFSYFLPLLLIVNTHIHCLAFAFLIGLDFLLGWIKLRPSLKKPESSRILVSILLVVALTILSGLPMLGSVGTASSTAASNVNFSSEGVTLTSALTGPLIFYSKFLADGLPALLIYIPLALFVINLLKHRPIVFWKTAVSLFFSLALQAFIFSLYLPQRIFMVIIFYLFFSATEASQRLPIWTELPVAFLLLIMTFQTGNIFCSVFLFAYLAQTLLPPYLEKIHGINFIKTLDPLAKISLSLLGLLSLISGVTTVYAEFKQPYTDAKLVADYLAKHYSGEKEVIILVDTPPLATYTSVLAYLPNKYKFINIKSGKAFTYAQEIATNLGSLKDDTNTDELEERKLKKADAEKIIYANECKKYITSPGQPCLYLTFYDPSFYDQISKMLEESGIISSIKEQELSGSLTLLLDSVIEEDAFEQAPYEHYRVYRINEK